MAAPDTTAPQLYYSEPDHSRDRPVLGALFGQEKTLMVDAGASPAHALEFLQALRDERGLPPSWRPDCAVLSHWHWDHSFGLSALGIPCYAHPACVDRLRGLQGLSWSDEALDERVQAGLELRFCADMIAAEYGPDDPALPLGRDIRITLPEFTVDSDTLLDLGGAGARLIPIDSDHSPDSLAVLVPQSRTVFLGDLTGAAYYEKPVAYRAWRVLSLFGKLWDMPADFYIEGHTAAQSRQAFFYEYAGLLAAARALADGEKSRVSLLRIALDAKPDADQGELHRAIAFLLAGEKTDTRSLGPL
jgi:glyoxylase-like metal-dependent hydrolase (beta-lactamase superfamily II)